MKRIKGYESEESFSYTFLGDGEINARTLTTSLNSVVNVLQESSNHYNPDAFVNLKVTAIKHGSFQIDLRALVEGATFLMAFGVSEYAELLIDALRVFLDLKRFLAGESPESISQTDNSVKITNKKGDTLVFNNSGAVNLFFAHPSIDRNLSDLFEVASADQTEGFVLKHKNKEVSITSDEYPDMARHLVMESVIEPQIQRFNVELGVRKPDLGGNSQWIVYGFGKKFPIAIEDSEWIAKVHSGDIMLANGTQIRVFLRVQTDRDPDGNIIEGSEKYFAEQVFEVISPRRSEDGQIKIE